MFSQRGALLDLYGMPRRTLAGEVEAHELESRARRVQRRKRPLLGGLDGQLLEIPAGTGLIDERRENATLFVNNQPHRHPDMTADAFSDVRRDVGDFFVYFGGRRGVGW